METKRNYVVYAHIRKTPSKNGVYKRYIGITCQKPENRWNNGKGYRAVNQPRFYNGIQKHGWENFEHKILIHGLTREQALNWEKKLIAYYKSNNDIFGYNNTTGGKYAVLNEESLQKMSKSMLGKNKGKNSALYKIVYCLETGDKFYGTEEASRYVKVDSSSIGRSCLGKQYTAGGLHWRYERDYLKLSKNDIENIIKYKHKRKSGITTKIKCLNNNMIYNSIQEASSVLNLNPRRISDVVNNKQKSTKGYIFVKLDNNG